MPTAKNTAKRKRKTPELDPQIYEEGSQPPEVAVDMDAPEEGESVLGDSKDFVPITLPTFDPEKMLEKNLTALLFGHRGAGKSVLQRHLLSYFEGVFDEAWLFSTTGALQPWNWDCFKKERVIDCSAGFREDLVDKIMEDSLARKMTLIAKYESKRSTFPDDKAFEEFIKKKQRRILIVVDDLVHDRGLYSSTALSRIATTGRHLGIVFFCSSQNVNRANSLGASCRGNMDFIFTTAMDSQEEYETLARLYFAKLGWKIGLKQMMSSLGSTEHLFVVRSACSKAPRSPADFMSTIVAPAPKRRKFMLEKKQTAADAPNEMREYGFKGSALKRADTPATIGFMPVLSNSHLL